MRTPLSLATIRGVMRLLRRMACGLVAAVAWTDLPAEDRGATAVAGRSAAARPVFPDDVRMERDVDYLGPARKEKADLYFPAGVPSGSRVPAVIIIHGGGFNGGHKDQRREIDIGSTLARHGYLGMSIDYKLWTAAATSPTWPQSLYDAKNAVRWLRRHADRLGVDADRIGVIGGSAGGLLAAMLAVTGPEDGFEPPDDGEPAVSTAVRCAVDLYGPADLMAYHDMRMFLASREEDPESYRKASPVTHCSSEDAPVLILHGTADKVVPIAQSEGFAQALSAAGVEHELIVIPEAPHTFDLSYRGFDVQTPVLEFLARHLDANPDEKRPTRKDGGSGLEGTSGGR